MRRVALKIAYIGSKFHGYQRQPNYRTVEGELLKAFFEAGVIEDTWKAHYSVAGRTDKGVHSTGNVISFITDETIRINYLNGLLPKDIKIIGEAKVPYGFKVRFPLSRTYTYIQPFNPFETDQLDFEKMKKAMKYFIGEHNFRNFSKRHEKNPNRKIFDMDMTVEDNVILFTVVGESFLWNMVRKMVTSLIMVGKNELETEDIKRLLQPIELRETIRLRPAPANGLILSDMNYKNIKFTEHEYSKEKLIEELKKEFMINEQEKYADAKIIDLLQGH
ncbi:tRNA pseudouridine(38-40) synthase TruA [Methanosphaera sp.]|uniref:tRNA pseudouridine(38-40) synthase TruA n=1 Tax=Methanosphaera sp. TaxID=2666342 RepID=UPI0025F7906F|nr:tRNA pseudouridine(38-40) synthase TruA [Methanosphaera sp.]MEE3324351.1 tRNA pseudouridine(38-40) synthase TruA [Methanosphaera sp.]MEE3418755.1 tRNA pseudouridine(38-40) synthase TruA [Methanosphaera sp.]